MTSPFSTVAQIAQSEADVRSRGLRPIDVVIIGAGTFGSILACQIMAQDRRRILRVLVLEAGDYISDEHVQNRPECGLHVPEPATDAQLRRLGQEDTLRARVWALPWHSTLSFSGLPYCIGGRSLFWGGWCPWPLASEWSERPGVPHWPTGVVGDLRARYLSAASKILGVGRTDIYHAGALHLLLRKRVGDAIHRSGLSDITPLSQLPDHPGISIPRCQIRDSENQECDARPIETGQVARLDAPLATETVISSRSVETKKFSTVAMLMRTLKMAAAESADIGRRRLLLAPNCHVNRLLTTGARVTGIETTQGAFCLAAGCRVVLALGTIENTRLAKLSFARTRNGHLLGQNLSSHLRSNLVIRIPRSTLPIGDREPLTASALVIRGYRDSLGGWRQHFHHQVTAFGIGNIRRVTEAQLLTGIDKIHALSGRECRRTAHVLITVCSVAEMQAGNRSNKVTLHSSRDKYGFTRATVRMATSLDDDALWMAMDRSADELALVLAGSGRYDVLTSNGFVPMKGGEAPSSILPFENRHEPLGMAHHEAGTLWMGTDGRRSVTSPRGRFWEIANAYAVGPALFPHIGSTNPVLPSTALTLRLADDLVAEEMNKRLV